MAENIKKVKLDQIKINIKENKGKLPEDKSESGIPKIYPGSQNPRHDKTTRKS